MVCSAPHLSECDRDERNDRNRRLKRGLRCSRRNRLSDASSKPSPRFGGPNRSGDRSLCGEPLCLLRCFPAIVYSRRLSPSSASPRCSCSTAASAAADAAPAATTPASPRATPAASFRTALSRTAARRPVWLRLAPSPTAACRLGAARRITRRPVAWNRPAGLRSSSSRAADCRSRLAVQPPSHALPPSAASVRCHATAAAAPTAVVRPAA